jgi:hypothetical protein
VRHILEGPFGAIAVLAPKYQGFSAGQQVCQRKPSLFPNALLLPFQLQRLIDGDF